MSSNLLTFEIPKVISFKSSGRAGVPQMGVSLTDFDPSHGTRSKGKPKAVKRTSKKARNRLTSAMAKGRAKARMRAEARAAAKKDYDLNLIELALGPGVFEETDSDSETVSEITYYHKDHLGEWNFRWYEDKDKTIHIVDEESSGLYTTNNVF